MAPSIPSSPSFLTASRGNCCASSHSITWGLTSASAKSRTICLICSCSWVRRKSIAGVLLGWYSDHHEDRSNIAAVERTEIYPEGGYPRHPLIPGRARRLEEYR